MDDAAAAGRRSDFGPCEGGRFGGVGGVGGEWVVVVLEGDGLLGGGGGGVEGRLGDARWEGYHDGLSVEDTGSTFIVTSVLLLAADDDDGGGSGMTSTFASGFLLVVTSSSLIFVRDRFLLLSLSFPSPPSLLLLFPLLLRFTRRALPRLRLGLLFLLLLLFAAAPPFGFLSLL